MSGRDFAAEAAALDPTADDFQDKALKLALAMLIGLIEGPYTTEERAAIYVEVVGPSRLFGRWVVALVDTRDGTYDQVRHLWRYRSAVRLGRRLADVGRLRYVDPDTPLELT